MSKIFGTVHIIVERIFQISESKRQADRQKFETFVKDFTPEAIHSIHEDLSGCHLRAWQVDLFQRLAEFYDSPANKYHNRRLQRKSEKIRLAFDKLNEFASTHFTPYSSHGYRIEFANNLEAREIEEYLAALSLTFGKACTDFYGAGRRVELSTIEWIVIIIVCTVAMTILVTTIVTVW